MKKRQTVRWEPQAETNSPIVTVRPGGRVSLMGGVGIAGQDGKLAFSYAWLVRNNITG